MIRRFIQAAVLLVCAAFAGTASAQAWPAAKPLRIEIAFGPGSASDVFARMIAEPLQKALGQVVLVEGKPGANGQIAAEYVAKSPADGYTLFLTTNTTHSANPFLYKKLSYDPVKDFTPISRVSYIPFMLVVDAKSPVQNVQELVAHAKNSPQGVSYAYSSSTGQVAAAALNNATKMNAVGVAYKSSPEALTSVAGGQVTFAVVDFATSQALVKSGRLRALAVTPLARSALAPSLPTISEASGLKDFGVIAWLGLFGPANLPQPVVERLNAEMQKIVTAREFQDKLVSMGTEPAYAGPEEFQRFVRSELAVWERQINMAGMKAE